MTNWGGKIRHEKASFSFFLIVFPKNQGKYFHYFLYYSSKNHFISPNKQRKTQTKRGSGEGGGGEFSRKHIPLPLLLYIWFTSKKWQSRAHTFFGKNLVTIQKMLYWKSNFKEQFISKIIEIPMNYVFFWLTWRFAATSSRSSLSTIFGESLLQHSNMLHISDLKLWNNFK